MRIEGHVGPATGIDGQENLPLRQGRNSELVVSKLHGKYYESVSRGNVWYGMSATTGISIVAAGNNAASLFNPLGSGVNCSLIRILLTYASGTMAVSGIELAYTVNAGASQATAGAITVFTNIAPVNALIGYQGVPRARFATTCSFTATPTVFGQVGISETAQTQAQTNNPFPLIVDYDGSIVVQPGAALSLTANAATTALYNVTFVWEEIPVTGGV